MKYKTCTDYWLNIDNMTLRGEFEEMYLDIDDPWGCKKGYSSLNNRVFVELLFAERKYERILDIGCGLGGFTNYLFVKNGRREIIGCDISSTAIRKASSFYPPIKFLVKDILKDEINDLGIFNLIVLNEIIWYILDDIERVFYKIKNVISEKGIIGIHQSFPYNQRLGKNIINGLSGFEDFLVKRMNFQITKKIVSYVSDGEVLLAVLEKGDS